jgi:hypothetical protein
MLSTPFCGTERYIAQLILVSVPSPTNDEIVLVAMIVSVSKWS